MNIPIDYNYGNGLSFIGKCRNSENRNCICYSRYGLRCNQTVKKDNKFFLAIEGNGINIKIKILLSKFQEYNPKYKILNKSQPKSLLSTAKATTNESDLTCKIDPFNILKKYVQCSNV